MVGRADPVAVTDEASRGHQLVHEDSRTCRRVGRADGRLASKRPGRCGTDGRQRRACIVRACCMVRADRLEGGGGCRGANVGRHFALARDDAVELDPCRPDSLEIAGLRGRGKGRHAFGGLPPPRDAPSGQRIENDAAEHGRPGRRRPPQHEPVAGRRGDRGIEAQHRGCGAAREVQGGATAPTDDRLRGGRSEVDAEARPVRGPGRRA